MYLFVACSDLLECMFELVTASQPVSKHNVHDLHVRPSCLIAARPLLGFACSDCPSGTPTDPVQTM
jgi:hypothetical protein